MCKNKHLEIECDKIRYDANICVDIIFIILMFIKIINIVLAIVSNNSIIRFRIILLIDLSN